MEKCAWACLAATLAIFAGYFFFVLQLFEGARLTQAGVLPAVLALAFFQGLVNGAAALVRARSDRAQIDRHAQTPDTRALRIAYPVLALGLVAAVAGALLIPASPVAAHKIALASQLAIVALALGEAAKFAVLALGLKRQRESRSPS